MEIQRTANAGVCLKMDGVSILLDGLADRVEGYLPTPNVIAQQLLDELPDALVFTHYHPDHCSDALLLPYRKQNLRPIYGPESLHSGVIRVGDVTITPVESRHIGKTELGLKHVSFILQGSKCIWFMGDAAPLQWQKHTDLPRPDVIIAPFAYGNTKAAWEFTCSLAKHVVMLHLPEREHDPYQLWDAVKTSTAQRNGVNLWIPEMGEQIAL